MIELDTPDRETLERANDVTASDLPRFAPATRTVDHPEIKDIESATREALAAVDFSRLSPGAEVAITAGSRGIHDIVEVLTAIVTELQTRDFEPFIIPAMGSHGGATAEGQVETLASLGITEDALNCEIRSSMDVEAVVHGRENRPVFFATDALRADGVLLVNRIKAHTDYNGDYESGLAKMAVIGLGKHRGAEATHNAALRYGFDNVIPDRARMLFETTPIVGGISIIENADHRTAQIDGMDVEAILDRESALLERSKELLPTLPVKELDMLIVDRMGKEISGTGMDTNVLGRVMFHGEDEPDNPAISRVYVRSLTEASHGNGLGVGLADFIHQDIVTDLDLTDTYLNVATSGEPARARLPYVVPSDLSALILACSTTGVSDPSELRVARIDSTLNPWNLLASEPVAHELADRSDAAVGDLHHLEFDESGDFVADIEWPAE